MISYMQRFFGPLLIVIFGMISLSFIFYTQMPSYDGAMGRGNLGKIDGHAISVVQFRQAATATSILFTMGTGQQIPETQFWKRRLENQAWQRLIFLTAAERMGITVDNQQI